MVTVTLGVTIDQGRKWIALVDPIPAGFEVVNPQLAAGGKDLGTPPAGDPWAQRRQRAWNAIRWDHQELRDDRVQWFADDMRAGTYELSYQAARRSTARSRVMPATIEAMYHARRPRPHRAGHHHRDEVMRVTAPTPRLRRGIPRALRATWRVGRWALVAALVPAVVAIQIAIVCVLAWPFDRDALLATSAPLTLVDVRGDEIATYPAVGADRTRWTRLGELPAIAVSAVIESEDQGFWRHRGVDGAGIARAAWLDLQGGRFGGSTLTMQLARMLTTGARAARRAREAARGPARAAHRARGRQAHDPRAVDEPRLLRQRRVRLRGGGAALLRQAAERALRRARPRCSPCSRARRRATIRWSGSTPRCAGAIACSRCSSSAAWSPPRRVHAIAVTELAVVRHTPANHAPHFARWILDQLPARRPHRRRHRAHDARPPAPADRSSARVTEQVAALRRRNLDQAGAVVLDAQTTEVRAMVGSASWRGPGGQINITTRRRHPGSALKPFVYGAAIERGDTPATIAWDTRDTSDAYFAPTAIEHGPVRYREALASSYNFAAIDVLERVGVRPPDERAAQGGRRRGRRRAGRLRPAARARRGQGPPARPDRGLRLHSSRRASSGRPRGIDGRAAARRCTLVAAARPPSGACSRPRPRGW